VKLKVRKSQSLLFAHTVFANLKKSILAKKGVFGIKKVRNLNKHLFLQQRSFENVFYYKKTNKSFCFIYLF